MERKRWWIPAAGIILFAALIYWQFYSPSRYLPPARASIVIVPFEIVGAGVDPAISQSLNEAIVTDVSKNPGLHVVSPSTVRRYQRIGFPLNLMARLLGSQVILEGTLQSSGDRVRATARLADVHSGKVIWAEGYEVPSGDNGAELQTARAIASGVGNRLAAGAR